MRGEAFPDVASAIVALIEQGAPLFNEGRARECAELYRRGAMAVLAMPPGGSGGPPAGPALYFSPASTKLHTD